MLHATRNSTSASSVAGSLLKPPVGASVASPAAIPGRTAVGLILSDTGKDLLAVAPDSGASGSAVGAASRTGRSACHCTSGSRGSAGPGWGWPSPVSVFGSSAISRERPLNMLSHTPGRAAVSFGGLSATRWNSVSRGAGCRVNGAASSGEMFSPSPRGSVLAGTKARRASPPSVCAPMPGVRFGGATCGLPAGGVSGPVSIAGAGVGRADAVVPPSTPARPSGSGT